jgi:3-oxoacyl-[acyl-carrier-protein] synthase II
LSGPSSGSARIVVTGVGAITPLGVTASTTWERVLRGGTAVRDWADLGADGHRVVRACRIEDVDAPETRRGRSLAIVAAREALRQSGRVKAFDGGVFIGSTLGESAAFEQAGAGKTIDLSDYSVSSFCDGVAAEFGLTGPREALATACAAGNYAIGAAVLALRQGRASWAIAGGVEPFSRLSMVGFSRSRAMASGDCKPFDVRRTGMLLGEGAAMLVLEKLDDALARGATPLAEVRGLGLSSDAHHPTAPRPDGRGMARAMRLALREAGVDTAEVDWVNVHGTGTRASDAAEGRALREVFADVEMPALSGSKGALGHSLGAAAAIEAVLCVSGLVDQMLPPTHGHEEVDPDIGLTCTRTRTVCVRKPLRVVMNNAFAFGGVNSTLVLSRWNAA